ncbi:MAG: hypothetical protein Q8P15_03650 [Nanoarchaeota archaeon]|nr:hypothetical protein [Nanoarchaeota archaeon]
MFLDDVIEREEKILNRIQRVLNRDSNLRGMHDRYKTSVKILKNKTKLFLIDEMVADSLYNVPHSNPEYESSIRLPFPFIFFEFEKPLRVTLSNNKEDNLQGMSFYKIQSFIFEEENWEKNFLPGASKIEGFSINLYFPGNEISFSPSILFSVDELPKFMYFDDEERGHVYDAHKDFLEDGEILYENKKENPIVTSNERHKTARDFYKLLDLSINLINYINAQNVEIVRKKPRELDPKNAKRLRKGKKPLVWTPTRPYYMIEVKKEMYEQIEKEDEGNRSWELNHRVWVRGHFYHFKHPIWGEKVGTCKWVPPHIRGPYNAPWKHNRYKIRYRNFRHLLKLRGNESLE